MHEPVRHRNPLPQLVPNRVHKLMTRVREAIWEHLQPLDVLVAANEGEGPAAPPAEALKLEYRPAAPGMFFGPRGGGWAQVWFKLDVPAAADGEQGRRHLLWNCQGKTTAHLAGDDGTLTPWAGLDNAHESCPLPDDACTLYLVAGCWQTGIWGPKTPIQPEGLRFNRASIGVRDEAAWRAWHDLDALADAMATVGRRDGIPTERGKGFGYLPPVEDASPMLRRLLAELERCCDAHVTGGVPGLLEATTHAFDRLRGAASFGTASIYGHAHIDMVWLRPE